MTQILVDSSFLIALYDVKSKAHLSVKEVADLYGDEFLIPQVVLTEVVYLLKRDVGLQRTLQYIEIFTASQPTLQDITLEDLQRVREIMQQYADAKLDFVDCCIMALFERLDITQVGTLDQRDFGMFRPKHTDYLEILP